MSHHRKRSKGPVDSGQVENGGGAALVACLMPSDAIKFLLCSSLQIHLKTYGSHAAPACSAFMASPLSHINLNMNS